MLNSGAHKHCETILLRLNREWMHSSVPSSWYYCRSVCDVV